MHFRIADTFTASLAKLNNEEQKAVKTTAFDLQVNPSNPGLQFHRLEKVKDPKFWSLRVSRDIRVLDGVEEEIQSVGSWLLDRSNEGVVPHEIRVFVRSAGEMERACQAVGEAGLPFRVLDRHVETASGHVSICTMHLAKGLEFRAVVVMACDDEVIPLQERIETVSDETDLEEVYNTERHLLYVACTRARDHLLVTSVDPTSESLDDLRG